MPARSRLQRVPLVVGGVVGVAGVVLFGILIHAVGNGPLAVDSWWHDVMLAWRTDAGLVVAHALDVIGGVVSMIVIGVAIVLGLLFARRPWNALSVVSAMLIAEATTSAMKVSFARPRPPDSLVTDAMTSFPSGHTSLAAAVMVVLAIWLRTALMWTAAALWVAAMGWSRTYLEAHWFSDVVAGAVLGASAALLGWGIMAAARRSAQRTSDGAADDQSTG